MLIGNFVNINYVPHTTYKQMFSVSLNNKIVFAKVKSMSPRQFVLNYFENK